MTFVRIKGFKIYTDRHGTRRCYHRATSTAIDLKKFPFGSLEFMGECERLKRLNEKAATSKPGTLGLLIKKYKEHAAFNDLSRRTQADYENCFKYLAAIDDTPLSAFNSPLVVRIRDTAGEQLGRKWGTYVKTSLSLIFSWGVERGYIDSNPALHLKGIRKPKDAPEANRPWSDTERHVVLARASTHLLLPLSLMMFCGLDPSDVTKLPKSAIKDGFIDTKRGKTRESVWLPLPAPVKTALAVAPKNSAMTVCASSEGGPWTYSGLDKAWQRLRAVLLKEKVIEPGLTMKGLRHSVATILAEMGYDGRTIADMLGQKTTAMGEHYSRRANKREKLTAVIKNFDEELVKRRTKVV